MRILNLCVLGILLIGVCGCQQKADDSGTIKTTASINNNAPEAKNALAAPVNPSIVMPGGKKSPPKSP